MGEECSVVPYYLTGTDEYVKAFVNHLNSVVSLQG